MTAKAKNKNTLMLVEDPRITIETICESSSNFFTWDVFKTLYEKKIGRSDDPVSKGTADTHFYSLTQLNFLMPKQEKSQEYVLSNRGKAICNCLKENRMLDYQKYLRNLLLNNEEKGTLFADFLNFIEKGGLKGKISISELAIRFQPDTTLRALISWCREANMIEVDDDTGIVWLLKHDRKAELSQVEFWHKLVELYEKLQNTEIFLVKAVFVEISEIRAEFCMIENWSLDNFDSHLVALLDSKYGKKIRLYGAPSSVYEEKRNFVYKGKSYIYIKMKG
jgi:hypothetical protein